MNTLVCDSSALIELAKRDLLAKMFETDFELAVPDLLFCQDFIQFGAYNLKDLSNLGFHVQCLDPKGVALSSHFRLTKPALSVLDSFALAIAKQENWCLLTEDITARTVASSEGVRHRNVLWFVDNLNHTGALSRAQAINVLESMLNDPRSTVSKSEIRSRLP